MATLSSQISTRISRQRMYPFRKKRHAPQVNSQNPLSQQLLTSCQILTKHALDNGIKIPPDVIQTIDTFGQNNNGSYSPRQLEGLLAAHNELVELVKPANPKTLMYLFNHKNQNQMRFTRSPVPMINQMTVLALLFIAIFIFLTIFQADNGLPNDAFDSRLVKLLELLYLLSVAGLGAAFAILFKANRFMVDKTFDPSYTFSYWIRFTLGVMAGLILALLIPLNNNNLGLTPILLALLGGFSADVLYRILTRLLETLESIVGGSSKGRHSGD